jgi:hypothetical protein
MKILTVHQPYAELIASGEKPIENRTWAAPYRGPLLIHAGKSRDMLDDGDERRYPGMPFGAVVAVARLTHCFRITDQWPPKWAPLRDHEHANGPWCWILEDVRRLNQPITWRGLQGLTDAPVELVELVAADLAVPRIG